MRIEKLKIAVVAGALGLTFQAHATLSTSFDLSYSDLANGTTGNTLNGDITANFISGSGNEYAVTSASLTLVSPSYPSYDGTYTLANSSSAFAINNIVYYPGDPIVDFWGVLTLQNTSGTYINLFSADPFGDDTAKAGYYALVGYNNGYINFYPSDGSSNIGAPATASLTPLVIAPGTSSLSAVPEPTTLIAGALTLLPFGASTLRILRRRQGV
jgi:hypothetical protein